MKYALVLIMILTVIIIGLSQPAIDPQDYTGQWYSANDQNIYLFQNGLIYCSRHSVALSDIDSVSGAYSYCRNSILLFAKGIKGLETEQELYLVHNEDGSFLCENKDGSGEIYFIRQKNDSKRGHLSGLFYVSKYPFLRNSVSIKSSNFSDLADTVW